MTKLFVGGLSFTTGAEVLGKLFETVGIVKAATIVTENDTSRGYGHVEMETPELAESAITKLNGAELEGRKIRVSLFSERPPNEGRRGGGRGGRRGFRRGGGFGGRGGFSNRRGGGFRGGFRSGGYGYDGGYGGGGYGGGGGYSGGGGYGRGRGRFGGGSGFGRGGGRFQGGRGGYRGGGGGGFPRGGGGFGRGRSRFGRRGGRTRPTADPSLPNSKTRIYITNLPFALTQQGLQKVFEDKGYQVKEVSLGTRRFNTALNVGYGFVEFQTEDEQSRVLKDLPTITIENRACVLSPARPPPPRATEGAGSD